MQITARIRKICKDFARELDFKDIKFSVKTRGIHKIVKKNSITIPISGYQNKQKYPIYVSRNTFKNHVDLLLTGIEDKRHYVLVKDLAH